MNTRILFFLLKMSAFFAGNTFLDAMVVFSDPRLQQAVLSELNRSSGSVSESELASITELSAAFHGINCLNGLEGATNLTKLNLFGNEIVDISPLANLINLSDLDLGANSISDFNPLADLTNILWLRMDLNPITSLAPISSLLNLQVLHINSIGLSSLEFLQDLNQLVFLSAANNHIEDASILGTACPLLKELNLSGNRITSAAFLEDFHFLAAVDLQSNFIDNLRWPAATFATDIVANQWYHVALVIDGGTTVQPDSLKVFFEGNLVGSSLGSQLWPHGADIGIGAMIHQTRFPDSTPDGDGFYFTGSIDDLRIYHRALTNSEVELIALGHPPSDMAVYWPFDGNLFDAVGSNNGSLIGNASFGQGINGLALVLDGNGSSVTVPDSIDINLRTSPTYTVSLFFKSSNPTTGRQIIFEQGGRTRGLNLYIDNGYFVAGAWNEIPNESNWAGAWLGQPLSVYYTRFNLSGNLLSAIPNASSFAVLSDWDLSFNQLVDLDVFNSVSGSGTLRIEGNLFDPNLLSSVASMRSKGIDVFGRFPSAFMNFSTWRNVFFLPDDASDESISGPEADPDSDGLINLFECAFGANPLHPDVHEFSPVKSISPNGKVFLSFHHRCPQIALTVKESTSLQSDSWGSGNPNLIRNPLIRGWTFERNIPLSIPIFLRIEAQLMD